MDNDNRIIRVGHGIIPLLSYIFSPHRLELEAHIGIYFDLIITNKIRAIGDLFIVDQPVLAKLVNRAAECCLVAGYTDKVAR